MKGKFWIGSFAVLAALILAAPNATAGGWYVGGSAGQTSSNVSVADVDDGGLTSGEIDDSGTAFKVFAGFGWLPFMSIEGGFVDLDQITFAGTSDGSGGFFAAGPVSGDFTTEGIFAAVVGKVPLPKSMALLAKVGMYNWDSDITFTNTSGTVTGSDDGTDPMYGVGIEFTRGSFMALRAEYEVFQDVLDRDIDLVTGNILFRF